MNKKFKVIQLNGPMGLLVALAVILVILMSIIFAPIYGVKFLWNNYISYSFGLHPIRLSQAALLWFAVVSLAYGYLRSKIGFKFVNMSDLPDNTMTKIDYEKFAENIKKEQEENEKVNR